MSLGVGVWRAGQAAPGKRQSGELRPAATSNIIGRGFSVVVGDRTTRVRQDPAENLSRRDGDASQRPCEAHKRMHTSLTSQLDRTGGRSSRNKKGRRELGNLPPARLSEGAHTPVKCGCLQPVAVAMGLGYTNMIPRNSVAVLGEYIHGVKAGEATLALERSSRRSHDWKQDGDLRSATPGAQPVRLQAKDFGRAELRPPLGVHRTRPSRRLRSTGSA